MENRKPLCIILAGPNGSGKTTISKSLLWKELEITNYVNADVIAQGLAGFSPNEVAFSAGELMLERIAALVKQKADFSFETTLANRTLVRSILDWKNQGYQVGLFFVWLRSVELNIERVRERVRRGGHNIPEETIRRRYDRSLSNFFNLYRRIVDQWRFIENTCQDNRPAIIAQANGRDETVFDPESWKFLTDRWSLEKTDVPE
jgi:predicted ABC-type ATPase